MYCCSMLMTSTKITAQKSKTVPGINYSLVPGTIIKVVDRIQHLDKCLETSATLVYVGYQVQHQRNTEKINSPLKVQVWLANDNTYLQHNFLQKEYEIVYFPA